METLLFPLDGAWKEERQGRRGSGSDAWVSGAPRSPAPRMWWGWMLTGRKSQKWREGGLCSAGAGHGAGTPGTHGDPEA